MSMPCSRSELDISRTRSASKSMMPGTNSVATVLPGALSAVMLSNNRSWASGGR